MCGGGLIVCVKGGGLIECACVCMWVCASPNYYRSSTR